MQRRNDVSLHDFFLLQTTGQSRVHHPPVANPEIVKEGRRTMYQPRRDLSQMHTTNYTPFIREKAAY